MAKMLQRVVEKVNNLSENAIVYNIPLCAYQMFVEAKCLIFASHKSAGEPPIKVVDWFPSSVVKTESNQDQKHLEASSSKDAFCLCSPLCPCRRSVHHDRIIFGILVFLTFWYLGIFGILTTRQLIIVSFLAF